MSRACLLFALVLLVPTATMRADPPPDKKQIAELIKELSARQFTKRERAQQKLWEAGQSAEEALREAARSNDAEIQRRAKEILAKFRWGIYPATPKKIVALIEKYQSSELAGRWVVARELLDEGSGGLKALLHIVEAEEGEETKRELYRVISREAGRALPLLAVEKNTELLEKLFELTLNHDRDQTIPHYVAFHYLQGSLDKRIAEYQKLAATDKDPEKAYEVLFYLYRARGDLKMARTFVEKARRNDLLVGMLEEQGQWEELARKDYAMEERQLVERLGYRSAYNRLARRQKEFDESIAALSKHAGELEATGTDRWNAVKSILLNARADEGLSLIGKGWSAQKKLDIYVAQFRFKEALELANNPPEGSAREYFDVARARTLHFLGKKDEALKLFKDLSTKLVVGTDTSWYDSLIEAEVRSGLKELAFDHCALAMVTESSSYGQARLLKHLYRGEEDTAQVWWTVLRRKQASENVYVSMKSLKKLMAGEIKGKELTTLLSELEAVTREPMSGPTPISVIQWLTAAAEIALKAGDETSAKAYFEKAGDSEKAAQPLIKWGDHLAKQKKWADAMAAYQSASNRDRRNPLALFLRGEMLIKLGKKSEGETCQTQSHWLPLGDDGLRLEFARELAMRGHHEASRHTRTILLRTCHPGSFNAGEARRLDGIEAARNKDFLKAAELHELAMLRCHKAYVNFIDSFAYVGVPHFIYRMRATGLTMANKFDEAKKDIAVCEALMPANIDLTIHVVPALEKLGRKKDAEEMYRKQIEMQRKLVKEYPESAALRNSLAWLTASLRRDLDEGQNHAEKAVELEPTIPGYRDTLAEILFQRGKKAEAITQMKKCLAQEPKRDYYKRQLARFEAGDTNTHIPHED